MDLLNRLRRINNDLIINSDNKEKYILIGGLLRDNNCFFHMKMATALTILSDLGFKDNEVYDMYLELISPTSFKNINYNFFVGE